MDFNMRSMAIALSLLLGAHALWALIPELIRPSLAPDAKFPATAQEAGSGSHRFTSDFAASAGLIRGDLWAERVYVDAAKVLGDNGATLTAQDRQAIRKAATRALSRRPIDPWTWLMLANLTAPSPTHNQAAQQLKMSYYTGPNDKGVMKYRLRLAMASQLLDGVELRTAVEREIRTILRRVPELRPMVVDAYRKAQPPGRELIERAAADSDPGFRSTLRAAISQ